MKPMPDRRLCLINTGTASAADIGQLIDLVRARVESACGAALVTEVKRVWRDAA